MYPGLIILNKSFLCPFQPPLMKKTDHQKTLNSKVEKIDKRLYQNESKPRYNWFPLDAEIFSKENKDFLNVSGIFDELYHFLAIRLVYLMQC